MKRFLLHWLIIAAALYVATGANLLPGLRLAGPWWSVLGLALVFGLVNALIRPIVALVTCLINFLTLGLFTLVINACMLYVTKWLGELAGLHLTIETFWWAILGALVVSIVSWALTTLFRDERERN